MHRNFYIFAYSAYRFTIRKQFHFTRYITSAAQQNTFAAFINHLHAKRLKILGIRAVEHIFQHLPTTMRTIKCAHISTYTHRTKFFAVIKMKLVFIKLCSRGKKRYLFHYLHPINYCSPTAIRTAYTKSDGITPGIAHSLFSKNSVVFFSISQILQFLSTLS